MFWDERDREENCGRKNKTECAEPDARQTGDKIHVDRLPDWRRTPLAGKEFSRLCIPNSQFARPDLILK
jgi:hypothetical protein